MSRPAPSRAVRRREPLTPASCGRDEQSVAQFWRMVGLTTQA